MILIELVYEEGCPELERARAYLSWAFVEAGVSARWTEWDLGWPIVPERVRGMRTPAILINGRNVLDGPLDASNAFVTIPSVGTIAAALRAAKAANPDVSDRP